MAGIFDLIKGLNTGISQGVGAVASVPQKAVQATSTPQAKQVIANLTKIALEKKRKEDEAKAKVQAVINAQLQAKQLENQTVSAPSPEPLDMARTGLAALETRFDPIQQLTKNIGEGYNQVRPAIVGLATNAISPVSGLLNNLGIKNSLNDFTQNAASGVLKKTFEDPIKNFTDQTLLARNKFQTNKNKNFGDYANSVIGSAASTGGLAMSALPMIAGYNAGVGALQGNERTKGIGDTADFIGSLPSQGLGALASVLPVSDEVKQALVMAGSLGLAKAGSKIGEGIGKRIDAGNLGRAASVVGKELTGKKATMFSGIDPTPFLKGVKEFAKNPIVQAIDPTGITTGLGATSMDVTNTTRITESGGEPPIPPVPPKGEASMGGEEMPKSTFDPEQYVKEQMTKRENAKKSETPSFKEWLGDTWSNIKTKLVDSTAPIEDILYSIKAKNKKNFSILPSKDIHNQIDRVFRTNDIAGQFMRDNGLDSIIKTVDNLDNLDQYLIAKHGQTLTKNGIETGRDSMKDAALVDSFAPKYEAQAQQVTSYSRKLLDYAVETGLVSKETAQALKEKYPDYVPFNRVFNDDGTFNSVGGKAVASLGKQSVVQKIVGSKREVESPLESLLQKTNEVFTQGEKNKAGKILSEYSSFEGNPFQMKQIKEVKDKAEGMDTISFYKNGEKQIWETTPEIAQAAKSLGVQQLNILGKIFALPVRIARVGITGLNIPFIGANIAKDQISAFINSKNSLRTSVANPKVFIQSLFSAVGHDKLYQEMVREGGGGSSFDMARSNVGKTMEQIRAGRNVGSRIKYTVTHPSQLLRAVENIVARGEEFTRLSQYKGTKDAMLAKGMNPRQARIEAARQARDTTVNFARKGEWGTVLNSTFMFLNANIQGTRTLLRNLKEDPVGTSTKLATVGLLPMAIATAWNLQDDKRTEVYDDLADYEKENNFIIIPENATKDEDGKWNVIKIPLSPDIKNLLNVSRRLVEQAHGKDPVEFGEVAKALLSTASPVGLDQQSLLSTFTPQAIKPTIEAVQNKSLFTGFPIVPRRLEDLPPEEQVKDNTSGSARILGKLMGKSPIQVEQFVKSTFGGVGSQATNALDTVLSKTGMIPEEQVGGQGILEGILSRFAKAQGGGMEVGIWGNKVKRDEGLAQIEKNKDDPVNKEILRLNYTPSLPSFSIDGVRLSNDAYEKYSREAGTMAKENLDKLIKDPIYQRKSDADKIRAIESTISNSRTEAKKNLGNLLDAGQRENLKGKNAKEIEDAAKKVFKETLTPVPKQKTAAQIKSGAKTAATTAAKGAQKVQSINNMIDAITEQLPSRTEQEILGVLRSKTGGKFSEEEILFAIEMAKTGQKMSTTNPQDATQEYLQKNVPQ